MQSLTGIRSSVPQMNRYPEGPGIKALFHSVRDIALILDKTVSAGYGYLKAGTVMATNISTGSGGGYGKLVPFVPLSGDVVLGEVSAIGISPVVLDSITDHVYVSLEDAYKYEVGDFLWADNTVTDDGPISGGVISAIDVTTSTIYADITVASLTATYVTVAKKAYVYTMAGASGNNEATYILDKDVDTGVGSEALGALTSVVVSNCILYKNSLYNLTTAAQTDLGVVDGRFFIMK
mgnify:CR=1 FL=1